MSLKYTDELLEKTVSGEAIAIEIDYFLSGLMKSLDKHFDIEMVGDDRGALAYEAISKWIIQSINEKRVIQ